METQAMPFNLEMEKWCLAPCLVRPEDALQEARRFVDEGSFYDSRHRAIWAAIDECARNGVPPERLPVLEWLQRHELLAACGGAEYLVDVISPHGWDCGNVAYYAECVAEYALRRGYVLAGQNITQEARAGDPDADLRETAAQILRNADPKPRDESSLNEALPDFEHLDTDSYFGRAVNSGILDLDEQVRIGGQKYVVIGARPGHGKTGLAMTYAANAVFNQGLRVLFYSNDQTVQEIKINALCVLLEHGRNFQPPIVAARKVHSGTLTADEARLLNQVKGALEKFDIRFVNVKGWDVERIVAHAEMMAQFKPPGLVVVDHVGRVRSAAIKGYQKSDAQQVSETSAALKTLTGKINCPVMALSQFNREIEKREVGQPRLSDLKDSGSLEADADIVLFPHRPGAGSGNEDDERDAQVVVAKNKNSRPGVVDVSFRPKTMRFFSR